MTDRDPDDDPQLKSLRAVWLSLPDEEPPQRGMADLLAAARAKAEQMASPPWWRRIADLLRRPPVLALATITVLIGGTLLIGKRDAEMSAPKQAPPTGAAPVIEPALPPAPGAAPALDPAGPVAAPAPPPPPPPALKTDRKAVHHAGKKPPKVERDDFNQAMEYQGLGNQLGEPVPTKEPATTTQAPPEEPAAAEQTLGKAVMSADKAGAVDAPAPNASAVKPPVPAKPTGASSTSSLIGQCRAAAARGDCAAVRALAARISAQDAAAVRDQLTSDAAIAKCLRGAGM